MGVWKFQHPFRELTRRLLDRSTFYSILFGAALAWISKDFLTPLIVAGNQFLESPLLLKFAIFFLSFVFFSFLLKGVFFVSGKLSWRWQRQKSLNTKINNSLNSRLIISLGILTVGALTIFLINNLLPCVNTHDWTYNCPKIIPTMEPVGNDFRTGLYLPPQMLLSGESIYYINPDGSNLTQYPPLVNLLYIPFQFFSEDQAYFLHAIFLFLANLACLWMAARMARDFLLPSACLNPQINQWISLVLFAVASILTFIGYPFLFSIERGNYDIIALLLAMLAIDNLLRKPNQLWVQVILLSIATHLKIYPAVLFFILFAKHKEKIILPVLVVNTAFLLALGPHNAWVFLQIIQQNVATGFTWVGNHSAFSMATYLTWVYQSASGNFAFLHSFFTTIPLVLWAASLFRLCKQKLTNRVIVCLLMASIPLMDVLPPISHDYKSVILNPAIILLLAILIVKVVKRSGFWDYFQLILIMGVLLILGRSFALNPVQEILLNHKYAIIQFFTFLILININQHDVESSIVEKPRNQEIPLVD